MPQGRILQFALSSSWTPDGSRLLIGAEGTTSGKAGIMVVDAETWEVTRPFVSDTSVQVMEWSDDGETLVTGVNYEGRIDVYDAALRRLRSVDLGEGGDVWDLAFSPDGTMLAAARDGGGVTVLDTRTWRPVQDTATMHADSTLDVEWLPDGNTVVSTGVDEVVSLYDVERDLVRARPLPASEVRNRGSTFLLPPSSDEVVALNEDGPGRRYLLDPAEWLAEACTVAGRNLTQAEWDRYLPDRPYEPVCNGLIPEE
jgi:WD40 repeat protein